MTKISDKIKGRIAAFNNKLSSLDQYDRVTYFANDNIHSFIEEDELSLLEDEVTGAFEGVLDALVIDQFHDPNSIDTARRLAKMYIHELMRGRYYPMPKVTAFPNDTKHAYKGMLCVRAEIRSVCAHHHQPVKGNCYIGIIPNSEVIGLSKYIRIAQWCAERGTLQEELCNHIAEEIMEATECEDVGVYIGATHGCCENRGVKAHSSLTQTTVLHGKFYNPDVKKEFFDNIALQEQRSR